MSKERPLNEFDIQWARIRADSERFALWMQLLRLVIVSVVIILAIALIIWGLLSQPPEKIRALSEVLHEFSAGNIIWALVALGSSSGCALLWKGRANAVKERDRLQQLIDDRDTN